MSKNKKIVPLETIERGLKDEDWYVRAAAMNACQGREVRYLFAELLDNTKSSA